MIVLKSPAELEAMRQAGRVVGKVMAEVRQAAKPGAKTRDLDSLAERLCRQMGAEPAFKGYRGYPYSLCCSPNEQVVHGFPSDQPLKEGDILSLDFGALLGGFYGDAAVTLAIGRVGQEAQRLMAATSRALDSAIDQVRPGKRLGDVSHAVQQVAEEAGFSVVRQFVGHGIGRHLHEDPQVPNYGPAGKGVVLKPGMVLAIEPMVNAGDAGVKVLEDGWTAVTVDGKLSAHFEHTVAVTGDGPAILSLP